jgi:hypothetical protein
MELSGQLHAPAALPPRIKPPGTHWLGGWVGPSASLEDVEKRHFLTLPGLELRVECETLELSWIEPLYH